MENFEQLLDGAFAMVSLSLSVFVPDCCLMFRLLLPVCWFVYYVVHVLRQYKVMCCL